jgi:nitronate monooxygenase
MRNAFMDMFGLEAPILQAPIGSASNVELATAVGRGGGMGSLAITWTEREDGLTQAEQLKAAKVPFFFNFALRFGTERIPWYLKSGIPAVPLSWGIDRKSVSDLKSSGIRVGVQVGSAAGAAAAAANGADFIIVQGVEAGGHVQSSTPLDTLLARAIPAAAGLPVIAAGGIACAADIVRVMKVGAQGVMMGTRFVASTESGAHQAYKTALVEAGPDDQVYTNCFDLGWPYGMHGVLRNATFDAWEAAGCPAAPDRPGEKDVVFTSGAGEFPRYSDTPPSADASGDIRAACLYAGKGVGHIKSIMPAAEIVKTLWAKATISL